MWLGQAHPEGSERSARVGLLVNDRILAYRRDGQHPANADRKSSDYGVIIKQIKHAL
jgi:hypothetical protein